MVHEKDEATPHNTSLDPHLLAMLVCPVTRGPLILDDTTHELISPKAALAYPIRDGIPIMLADEARRLEEHQHQKYLHQIQSEKTA